MKPIIRLDLFNPAITTVTATGPVTPSAGVDVSGVIGEWRVCCQITSQTAGKTFQVHLEGSSDGFATDIETHLIAGGSGAVSPAADEVFSIRKHQLDSTLVIGYVNGSLRCNVKEAAGRKLATHALLGRMGQRPIKEHPWTPSPSSRSPNRSPSPMRSASTSSSGAPRPRTTRP